MLNKIFLLFNLLLLGLVAGCKPSVQNLDTQSFFASQLLDSRGQARKLSDFRGQVLVLNFWATWCPPCREEIPDLVVLRNAYQRYHVEMLGIAIDSATNVARFLQTTNVPYPILLAENEGMALASSLGNRQGVLPYTLLIDTQGHTVKSYLGRIDIEVLKQDLKTLIEPISANSMDKRS